jgi:DNA repair exonuclease SbcCD nuclease subunit
VSFRFLHLADLHLETPFGGRLEVRARLRAATLEAFERAVELALRRELHAVLIAGDAYDDRMLSRRTELFFVRGVRRLAEAGVHVCYVCGNHDPGASGKRAAQLGLEGDEEWQARVHLFRKARPELVQIPGADGEPVGVVVGAGHPREREERDLAAQFTKLDTHLPVVGLLHTQVADAARAEDHDRYAPSERADFERVGYDYWALGHVHMRQQAWPDLPVFYAGNLQGRNPRETGAKGGLVVELEAGVPAEPEFEPLAPVRWERLELDGLAQLSSADGLLEALARRVRDLQAEVEEAELCLRIVPTGPSPLAHELNDPQRRDDFERELMERAGLLEVQLRPHRLHAPYDLAALRQSPSVLQRGLELCERAAADDELLEHLAPAQLARFEGREAPSAAERRAYLRELLAGLDAELAQRCVEERA